MADNHDRPNRGRKGADMAYHLTIRPTRYGRPGWEALHLGVLPTTVTPCRQATPADVERVLTRMVDVGMLPTHTTWSVQDA